MHQPMARMHAFPSLKTGTHLAPVNAFARKRSPLRQELPLKGLIFSELIRFMEEKQNPLFVEQVIAAADLPNDAAFSRIGVYPTAHALLLVGAASQLSGIPVAALCEEFGTYLFGRFNILYPDRLKGARPYVECDLGLGNTGSVELIQQGLIKMQTGGGSSNRTIPATIKRLITLPVLTSVFALDIRR